MNELATFGFLANALDSRTGSDGDMGAGFPRSDAEDLSRGARFIPGEVTLARRAGKHVVFITKCGPCCWYWQMPNGSRIYHWEESEYERIARANGHSWRGRFEGNAGPCPKCGNQYTEGQTVPK